MGAMNKRAGVAEIITVAELARQRGVHRSTARRWLQRMARLPGAAVWRDGTGRTARLCTTATALARVAPDLVEFGQDVHTALRTLGQSVATLSERVTHLAGDLREISARVAALESAARPTRA